MNKQNWTPTKVKDVAKIVSGATPKTSIEENWGGDIPWLTPKDLSDNPAPYTSHGSRFLTEQGFNSCSTHMLPKGTVLLTSRAPVGYVSVAANDICTNQGFKSLVLEDGQVSEFWYYLLSANTETLLNYSGGSTFKELSKRSLEQIEFLVPPIEEQREIVNLMQSLDAIIQAGDREIASADQMRGDILRTLLTDARESCEPVKVKEVAQIVSGATPKTGKPEYWGGDIPWITPKDLSEHPSPYTSRGARSITEEGFKSCSTHMLPKGAVLLTSRAPVGYVSVAANDICTNQGFKSLILDESQVPEFWYYLLWSNTETLLHYSGGSTFKELSKTSLGEIEFLLPPLEEQEKIVARMQTLDTYIDSAKRSQEALKQVRQDALHALLSGDKDVSEVAEMFATDEDVA